jgi:hypothetical protein
MPVKFLIHVEIQQLKSKYQQPVDISAEQQFLPAHRQERMKHLNSGMVIKPVIWVKEFLKPSTM